jgi:hypothetical protein
MIEIRTPATNFDAAAPSGCLFKTTEKMAVSYRKFTPIPGSNSPDKKEYMYVILTYDLDDKYQNNLDLDQQSCGIKSQPPNLFIEEFIYQSDDILDLMVEFSRKYEDGNKNNNAWRTMWNLLENYYKVPGFGLNKIFGDVSYKNIPFISELKKIFESMNKLKNVANTNKKIFTEFRQASVVNLLNITKEIGDYYKKYCLGLMEDNDAGGTEEMKGEIISSVRQEKIKCDNELVEKIIKMLIDSNKPINKTNIQKEILSEINKNDDPLEYLTSIVKQNNEYNTFLAGIDALNSQKPADELNNAFEEIEYEKYNEIIQKNNLIAQSVLHHLDLEGRRRVSNDAILIALGNARIFAYLQNADFDAYTIEYQVKWVKKMLDMGETEEGVNLMSSIGNKRERDDVSEVMDQTNEYNEYNEEDMGQTDENDENDENEQISKKPKFGGKIKTSKISKKYKNKLTRRKLEYKNKNTHKKAKNLKHRYSRRNK